MVRKYGRVDAVQQEMTEAARAAGAWVWSMADIGNGFPDLLIHCPWSGAWHLIECKAPKGRMTPAQRRWHEQHPGAAKVCRSVEELLRILGRTP